MGKYTPDRRGIGQYLRHDKGLKRELHRRAILGQGTAVAFARSQHHDRGVLASSSEVRDDGPAGGIHGDRMQFSIHFTARHAVPVTYPRGDRTARAYLLAAIPVMERGR